MTRLTPRLTGVFLLRAGAAFLAVVLRLVEAFFFLGAALRLVAFLPFFGALEVLRRRGLGFEVGVFEFFLGAETFLLRRPLPD